MPKWSDQSNARSTPKIDASSTILRKLFAAAPGQGHPETELGSLIYAHSPRPPAGNPYKPSAFTPYATTIPCDFPPEDGDRQLSSHKIGILNTQ